MYDTIPCGYRKHRDTRLREDTRLRWTRDANKQRFKNVGRSEAYGVGTYNTQYIDCERLPEHGNNVYTRIRYNNIPFTDLSQTVVVSLYPISTRSIYIYMTVARTT